MKSKDRGLTSKEIEEETRKLASDLAFAARSPVNIQLAGGSHVAFTFGTDEQKKQHQIPIVMNPEIITPVRNKEQAIRIWRGIGFHELAHHLFPAESQYRLADKGGFRHLFNLIDDEQNERRGRALDPAWGACFQSVCAYLFPAKGRNDDTLSPGIPDGDKEEKKPRGIAASKIYGQRWNQFAFHLRRHVPGAADPIVAEALELIPKRFKDLSKDELLELTRRIHETLSRGIELPKPGEEGQQADEETDEQPDQEAENDSAEKSGEGTADDGTGEDKDESGEPEEGQPGESGSWSVRRLLTSKWLLIPLALFVFGWSMLLLKAGVNFWVQVAIILVLCVGGLITFLVLRWAFIKAMLASIKRSLAPRAAPSAGAVPARSRTAGLLKIILILVSVLIALGLIELVRLHRFSFDQKTLWLFADMLAIVLCIGCIWSANKLKNQAIQDDRPIESHKAAGVVVASVVAFSLLVLTLGAVGTGLLLLGAVIVVLGLGVILILLFRDPPGKASGKRGRWRSGRNNGQDLSDSDYVRTRLRSLWQRILDGLEDLLSPVLSKAQRFIDRSLTSARRVLRRAARFTKRLLKAVWKAIAAVAIVMFGVVAWVFIHIARLVARIAVFLWRIAAAGVKKIMRAAQRLYWKLEPRLAKLWRHGLFRLAILALPIAVLLVILYAVLTTASKVSPWFILVLILLLLILLMLGLIFRKQLARFVTTELLMPMPELMNTFMPVPLDMHTDWFVQVDHVVPVEPNQSWLDAMLPEVQILAQQLRPHLKRCGRQVVDLEDQPDGFDLIDEAELALVGETSIFVNDDTVPKPSLHLEVALDCSGSMSSATMSLKPGEKFLLGKTFALILEQATLNLPGVSAHFWGFTDHQIFDCGVPGEGKVSGLTIGGGNNDAAMLWHMGQSAAESGKDVKILLMLSDGQPSECSWLSLHNLVLQFEQEGMIPWNFALDVIKVPAFERFFTDLVGQSLEEAIATMGETLAAIAQEQLG